MVIKIHKPGKGQNCGSVANLVEYLDKENAGLQEHDRDDFFNHDGDYHSAEKVERSIDNNKMKLKHKDTKFYMMTVNPSRAELEHLQNVEKQRCLEQNIPFEHADNYEVLFKDYIKDLMDEYAKNFNREYPDGKPLEGKDLVYYAKVEHQRTYKFGEKRFEEAMNQNKQTEIQLWKSRKALEGITDTAQRLEKEKEIDRLEKSFIRNDQGTIIKEGALKDGDNLHAHIIISRLDKSQTMQLSPMANHKQSKNILNGKEVSIGFNRDVFVGKGEELFDKKFAYDRSYQNSYQFYKETKTIRGVGNVLHLSNPKAFAKMAAKRAIKEMIQDKTLQKQLGYVMTDPRKLPQKQFRKAVNTLERKAIESVVKAMGAASYTNPITAGVQVAKQAVSIAAKTVSKGMGI